ncbi:hypothetical protein RSSM_00930 [Rhodopirellula sallentina SM41]|uniref:Uncharacterized protein n=1 Tax=Rhodopirellula sallentina SM41 TaxID=1263870 RepID=M5U863_9BACT|nr:hypothetical protein RSSM_00930 [Rhodopirellula sallentina SM41]
MNSANLATGIDRVGITQLIGRRGQHAAGVWLAAMFARASASTFSQRLQR